MNNYLAESIDKAIALQSEIAALEAKISHLPSSTNELPRPDDRLIPMPTKKRVSGIQPPNKDNIYALLKTWTMFLFITSIVVFVLSIVFCFVYWRIQNQITYPIMVVFSSCSIVPLLGILAFGLAAKPGLLIHYIRVYNADKKVYPKLHQEDLDAVAWNEEVYPAEFEKYQEKVKAYRVECEKDLLDRFAEIEKERASLITLLEEKKAIFSKLAETMPQAAIGNLTETKRIVIQNDLKTWEQYLSILPMAK